MYVGPNPEKKVPTAAPKKKLKEKKKTVFDAALPTNLLFFHSIEELVIFETKEVAKTDTTSLQRKTHSFIHEYYENIILLNNQRGNEGWRRGGWGGM